ncbi:MAG: hypothetical protein PHI98_03095 [Eubacteriales bacterium]|nr:hypothetical protein [Eubacteriales bacterium]
MKKGMAALLVLLLSFSGWAAAEDAILTFTQPANVEICMPMDLRYFPAPDGLQPMYTVMGNANSSSSVYLFIMPNGRVLLSVSSTLTGENGSAQTLLDAWPQIAASLASETGGIEVDAPLITAENCYGFDGVRIRTPMTLGGDAPLTLSALGEAFYRENALMELWTVQPDSSLYSEDSQEARELTEDLEVLAQLKDSFSWRGEEAEAAFTEGQDPASAFFQMLP